MNLSYRSFALTVLPGTSMLCTSKSMPVSHTYHHGFHAPEWASRGVDITPRVSISNTGIPSYHIYITSHFPPATVRTRRPEGLQPSSGNIAMSSSARTDQDLASGRAVTSKHPTIRPVAIQPCSQYPSRAHRSLSRFDTHETDHGHASIAGGRGGGGTVIKHGVRASGSASEKELNTRVLYCCRLYDILSFCRNTTVILRGFHQW